MIYFKVSDRRQIKELRHGHGKIYQKSSRRLLELSERLEQFHSYLFTSTIRLDSSVDWYDVLKSHIHFQQDQPIWMSDNHSISDKDLLRSNEYFISTRFNSLDEIPIQDQSSLYSDMIRTDRHDYNNYLQRVASDPGMFKKDFNVNISSTDSPEDDDNDDDDDESIFFRHSTISLPNRSRSVIGIPQVDDARQPYRSALGHLNNLSPSRRSCAHLPSIRQKNNIESSLANPTNDLSRTNNNVHVQTATRQRSTRTSPSFQEDESSIHSRFHPPNCMSRTKHLVHQPERFNHRSENPSRILPSSLSLTYPHDPR